jgi:hypothetical protein
MRSSLEEAVSQLNKWKSEGIKVYISSTGIVTLCLEGRISHASKAEVHVEIPGIDSKSFLISFSLHNAKFEYRDGREPSSFFKPRRMDEDFECFLEAHLSDGKRIVFAELSNEPTN